MAASTFSSPVPECDAAYWRDSTQCKLCRNPLLVQCCCGLSERDHRSHCQVCGHVVCLTSPCSRVIRSLQTGNIARQNVRNIRTCGHCWVFHFVCLDPTQPDNIATGDVFDKRKRKRKKGGKSTSQRVVWVTVKPGSTPVILICWAKLTTKSPTAKSRVWLPCIRCPEGSHDWNSNSALFSFFPDDDPRHHRHSLAMSDVREISTESRQAIWTSKSPASSDCFGVTMINLYSCTVSVCSSRTLNTNSISLCHQTKWSKWVSCFGNNRQETTRQVFLSSV